MDAQHFRESATDAIRYWELRRLFYNLVLTLIVLLYFALGYPVSRAALSVDHALMLFLLAVLANVAYCAAYVVDVFVQASDYRNHWRKYRWIVFAVGLLFASVLTRFWASGLSLAASR